MALPVVAIVGRPNVGKSTLFNRLIGFQKSVVHDRPGVTRDRLYEEAELFDRRILAIDTGGLEPVPETQLLRSMRQQSLMAAEEADVILFVVDGRSGFVPADEDVANILRRSSKPVILVVNKIDGPKQEDLTAEFWSVGLEHLVSISAEHGRGWYEFIDLIRELLPPPTDAEKKVADRMEAEVFSEDEQAIDRPEFEGPIRIAVIGRPNIGKSTLINHMLGEERNVVHNSPGTTMDPVDSLLSTPDRDYVLVDTAGVRKRAKIDDKLERWVSLRSIRAIERCHVCLLMIDALEGPTEQDAKLAKLVTDRGRALILLINKWDQTKDNEDINAGSIEDDLVRRLPHAEWAPHLFISALTGKGVHRILPTVERIFVQFDKRISTSQLNRFLEQAVLNHTPPQRHHRPVRLYFMTQPRVRPPTFVFWSNTPDGIAAPYKRYLSNRLREAFDLEGTPIRMHFRKRRKAGEGTDDE